MKNITPAQLESLLSVKNNNKLAWSNSDKPRRFLVDNGYINENDYSLVSYGAPRFTITDKGKDYINDLENRLNSGNHISVAEKRTILNSEAFSDAQRHELLFDSAASVVETALGTITPTMDDYQRLAGDGVKPSVRRMVIESLGSHRNPFNLEAFSLFLRFDDLETVLAIINKVRYMDVDVTSIRMDELTDRWLKVNAGNPDALVAIVGALNCVHVQLTQEQLNSFYDPKNNAIMNTICANPDYVNMLTSEQVDEIIDQSSAWNVVDVIKLYNGFTSDQIRRMTSLDSPINVNEAINKRLAEYANAARLFAKGTSDADKHELSDEFIGITDGIYWYTDDKRKAARKAN